MVIEMILLANTTIFFMQPSAFLRWIFLVLTFPGLLSCASSAPPKQVIALSLTAASDLNPDVNGRASPVAVTIYQLASTSGFRKSDYRSLTENNMAVLGKDLLEVNTITIRPGQTLNLEYPVSKGERGFGVVVGYRIIDTSGWQLIYEYPREKSGFWSRFGSKEVSSHKLLIEKNRVQFATDVQKI